MYTIKGTVSCDAETVRSQLLALNVEGLEPENAEQAESISAARNAAADMILAGALGTQDKYADISINGVVNPGHEPGEGTNDAVTVSIIQR